jgi:peptidoglycan-N-acetylglucosamine deacetylase
MVLHRYFIKTPWIVKKWFSSYVWNMPRDEKTIYLTFDDGPHPEITLFVLDELKKYNAKGSFFCLGSNVALHPKTYQKLIEEGHATGNHTYDHPNGWEVSTEEYVNDISKAAQYIQSNLFRPPYGRITKKQAGKVKEGMHNGNTKIIMWDVLSADFDSEFSPQQCLNNVLKNATNGSIVVFHDSEKAFRNLEYSFPRAIKQLSEDGYNFKKLEL